MTEQDVASPERSAEIAVRIALPPVEELPIAEYANFAAATLSEHEVMITFAQFSPPSDETELAGLGTPPVLRAKPVARIAIPRTLLTPLVDVLTRQMQAQASREGESALSTEEQ